jgi:hypothetical protein
MMAAPLSRPEVATGRDDICGVVEDVLAWYEGIDQVVEGCRDPGGRVTFVVLPHRAKPQGGSGLVAAHYAIVETCMNGPLERFTTYTYLDQAAPPPNGFPRNPGRRCPRSGYQWSRPRTKS